MMSDPIGERTSKMNPPPSPGLVEVIRLLLRKIERTAYPRQDPASIEDLKVYLRGRIAELEAEKEIKPSPPKKATLRPAWTDVLHRR